MKKSLLSVLFVGLLISSCSPLKKFASKTDVDYAATITEEDIKEMLTVYASDEFGGREAGEPSEQLAVEYLVNQYKALGIKAPNGEYRQEVPLVRNKKADATLSIGENEYEIGEDFINYFTADDGAVSSRQIAYLNYGIEDEAYSDYEGIDIEGKIAVMRMGEPMINDSTFLITGTTEPSMWSDIRQSYRNREASATDHGAIGLILILEDGFYNILAAQYEEMTHGKGTISLENSEEENTFYSFFANSTIGNSIIQMAENEMKSGLINQPISIAYKNDSEPVSAHNVMAYIEGEEFPDELIVLSAHLDHVGIDEEGKIYNGADDDGSGTIAILEIAEAFQQAVKEGHRPRRSILFLHVTGEEKGLLGSQYYTDFAPVIPLENTVTNLNIDMIGRIDPKREGDRNYVYLIGSDKLSTELHELSEAVNEKYTNITLDYTYNDVNDPNRYYYRSDHYNFAKNNIPVIFYFNGTHDDYHKHTDTIDKIEWDLLKNRTQLVFYTAWELANRDKPVVVDVVEEE